MSTPAVSVIMPVHNPDDRLRRALNCVRSQTMPDWEAVVVDDGSEVDLSWVRSLDPRVTLHRQPRAGVSAARNIGINLSTAPWVALLDYDDEWFPDKLRLQLDALPDGHTAAAAQSSFCHTGFEWVLPDRRSDYHYERGLTYHDLLSGGHVCASTVLAHRDAIARAGAFNPLLKMGEDTDLWLRLSVQSGPPVLVNQVLARYYTHDTNSSRDYWTGFTDRRTVLAMHASRARRLGDAETVSACRSGLATARRLAGAQAFDAARAELAVTPRSAAVHLGRAAALQPRYTLASVARWLAALASPAARRESRGDATRQGR